MDRIPPGILIISILIIVLLTVGIIGLLFRSGSSRSVNPSIREIPNFLSAEECQRLREIASSRQFVSSRVYSADSDNLDEKNRISQQVWLEDSVDPLVGQISDRIADFIEISRSHQESLQVVRYSPGGKFEAHYDACNGSPSVCSRMNGIGSGGPGPRLVTFLIYLNDGYRGGTTTFPRLNRTIIPQTGKVVIFDNIDRKTGKIIESSLHAGDPLIDGEKWIANKWIHLRPWNSGPLKNSYN
jgi:prolyl 4-hydroxylase